MRRSTLIMVAATCMLPVGSTAQVVQGSVTVEPDGTPLERAWVEISLGSEYVRRVLTDSLGHYSVELPSAGEVRAHATNFGYSPSGEVVRMVEEGETVELDFALAIDPILLDEIVAMSNRNRLPVTPGRVRFSNRALDEPGLFLDPLNLAWEQVTRGDFSATDLVRVLPGVRLTGAGGLRSNQGTGCMAFTVNDRPDGLAFTSFSRISGTASISALDDTPVSRIAAIEVYRTHREVPEDLRLNVPFGCGLLNVWTWGAW